MTKKISMLFAFVCLLFMLLSDTTSEAAKIKDVPSDPDYYKGCFIGNEFDIEFNYSIPKDKRIIKEGVYYLGNVSGQITIDTSEHVCLFGNGTNKGDIPSDISIKCTKEDASVSFCNTWIVDHSSSGHIIDFTGKGNQLSFSGRNVISVDSDGKTTRDDAIIHVPNDCEVQINVYDLYEAYDSPDYVAGELYISSLSGVRGSAIGGDYKEPNGIINLYYANDILFYGCGQGTLIGSTGIDDLTPGKITIERSGVFLRTDGTGIGIGGSDKSVIDVKEGSDITSYINSDAPMSTGELIYEGRSSIRSTLSDKSVREGSVWREKYGINTPGVHENIGMGDTKFIPGDENKNLRLMHIDASNVDFGRYMLDYWRSIEYNKEYIGTDYVAHDMKFVGNKIVKDASFVTPSLWEDEDPKEFYLYYDFDPEKEMILVINRIPFYYNYKNGKLTEKKLFVTDLEISDIGLHKASMTFKTSQPCDYRWELQSNECNFNTMRYDGKTNETLTARYEIDLKADRELDAQGLRDFVKIKLVDDTIHAVYEIKKQYFKRNFIIVDKDSYSLAGSKLKNSGSSFKIKATTNSKGRISFKKLSGDSRISVTKNGKITLKRGGYKKKTYKVKVRITASAKGNYKKTSTVGIEDKKQIRCYNLSEYLTLKIKVR